MEIYLYCSYANAARGFFLTRLGQEGLEPADLSSADGKGEEIIDRLFTYDEFRILWQEYPKGGPISVFRSADGGVFGVRRLEGEISGRRSSANFAVSASRDELGQLERFALSVISNPDEFAGSLFRSLFVGGECGYRANAQKLKGVIERYAAGGVSVNGAVRELLLRRRGGGISSERDLLRFAVRVCSWEDAAEHMGPRWLWKSCPPQVIDEDGYAELLAKGRA